MKMHLPDLKEKFDKITNKFFDKKMEEFATDEIGAQKYIDEFEKILNFIEHNQNKIEWFIRIILKYKIFFKWFKK